MPDKRSQ